MDAKANVRDIDSLMRAKSVFARARSELLQAVSEALADAKSVEAWIEREGPLRWENERRRAAESVAAAKSALYRKEMTPAIDGGKVSVVDERKALQRASARLDRAEQVLRRLRALRTDSTREFGLLRAGLGPLSSWVDHDSVEAQATITRMAEALDRYRGEEIDIASAARARGDAPLAAHANATEAGGMTRAGDVPPAGDSAPDPARKGSTP
ncbi:MAG: hypothetical protein FGM37_00325 [Phycisphaerales bacterium]|nr:hypothetical protein [Phycisphaerales bacterium]